VPSTAVSSGSPFRCSLTTTSSSGCRGRPPGRSGVRRSRDADGPLRGNVEKRARAHQDPGPVGHDGPGATRGPVPGRPPPYGYRLADAGAHPNPGKAADGKRLHRLEVDPSAAPVVKRIFASYIAGHGFHAIAEDLTGDGIPSPSAHDPARNRHRDTRAWSKFAVRAILMNPKYTGRQVWNRQRRDEVLLDVDDVAAGYQSRMRWNDASDWVWSADQMHEAIVSSADFTRAQAQMAAGGHRPTTAKRHRTNRTYILSGLVTCGLCGRKMQGSYNHEAHHYRCQFPANYAAVKGLDHPKAVYVRESAIVPKLDEWIGTLFDPANLDETCEALAMAGGATEADHARIEAAKRKLADCDERLGKYRKAIDAGADLVVVAGWMAEVQGELAQGRTGDRTGSALRATHKEADPRARIEPPRHRFGTGDGRPEIEGRGLRRTRDHRHLRPRDQDRCCRITAGRRV
jgi:site-specific DNA recombinase